MTISALMIFLAISRSIVSERRDVMAMQVDVNDASGRMNGWQLRCVPRSRGWKSDSEIEM